MYRIQDFLVRTWSHNQRIALCCALLLENTCTYCWPHAAAWYSLKESHFEKKVKLYWFSYRIMYISATCPEMSVILGHTYYSAVNPIYRYTVYPYTGKNCLQNQHTTHLFYTQLVVEFICGHKCISAHNVLF